MPVAPHLVLVYRLRAELCAQVGDALDKNLQVHAAGIAHNTL